MVPDCVPSQLCNSENRNLPPHNSNGRLSPACHPKLFRPFLSWLEPTWLSGDQVTLQRGVTSARGTLPGAGQKLGITAAVAFVFLSACIMVPETHGGDLPVLASSWR